MFECFLCKSCQGELCSQCANKTLEFAYQEREYVCQTTQLLIKQLNKRLNSKKLVLKQKIKQKLTEIQEKKVLLNQKRKEHDIQKDKILRYNQFLNDQKEVTKSRIKVLDQIKQQNEQYYNRNENVALKATTAFKYNLYKIKRFQILNAQGMFDLFKDYSNYSLGEKEFKIQKISLLKNFNEFVLIDKGNLLKSMGELVPDSQSDFVGVSMNSDFSVVPNYIESNSIYEQISRNNSKQHNPFSKNNQQIKGARERSDTQEEFDNFQGDCSTDIGHQQQRMEEKKQILQAKKIKEEYASFITLSNMDLEFSGFGDIKNLEKKSQREEKITGFLYSLCQLVIGICNYLVVSLPYPVKFFEKGMWIADSADNEYPLFLTPIDKGNTQLKHQIQFENGIILMDKNIQYLLYLNGYELRKNNSELSILNINQFFTLDRIGKSFQVKQKFVSLDDSDNEENFEVLKLKSKTKFEEPQIEELMSQLTIDNNLHEQSCIDLKPVAEETKKEADKFAINQQRVKYLFGLI